MRPMTLVWIVVAAGSIIAVTRLHSSRAIAEASCDAACQVNTLGWKVVESGTPLWFHSPEGQPRIDVAIAELGRPASGDEVRWAKMHLAGRSGMFGPLGDCQGSLAIGPAQTGNVSCNVPPSPDGARQGALFSVATAGGVQVIGMVLPANIKSGQINYGPLHWLANAGGDASTKARAARAAIAMFAGPAYYVRPDAGADGPAIEAVYHLWNFRATGYAGVVDQGADFVLLKDGEVWRDPGAGPRDIDASRFKESRWYDWGTWRQEAGGISIALSGHSSELMPVKKFQRYEPATGAGKRVDGSWKWTKTVYTGKNSFVQNNQTMTLHADGRFERDGFAFSNAPRTGKGGGAHFTGHYRIDGYTLNLNYDDGTKVSALFYWAGGGNNTHYDMYLINGASWLGGLAR